MKTYSVKEIAKMLHTSEETVRRWIRDGKLEATQDSRKGGNQVTEQMLNAFLKNSPKYAKIAAPLMATPVGMITATATMLGGVIAQQYLKNEKIKQAQVDTGQIRELIQSNMKEMEESIRIKKATIKQLQQEIEIEQQRLKAAEELLETLETENKPNNQTHNM